MGRPAHLRTVLVAVGVVLALTACADDAETDPPPGQDTEGESAPAEEGLEDQAVAQGEAQVEVADFAFDPAQLTVAAQATVSWTNQDTAQHTVTAGEPDAPDDLFDEELEAGGGSASVTFDEPGTFVYHCRLHPNMTGEIVVEQAPA